MIEFLKDPFGRKAIRRLTAQLKLAEKSEFDLSQIADRLEGELRHSKEVNKTLTSRLSETVGQLAKAKAIEGEQKRKIDDLADDLMELIRQVR